jgi:hypothetical protein
MIMAHELQHLVHFSQTAAKGKRAQDMWIDEGASSMAEYLYNMGNNPDVDNGNLTGRIKYYTRDQIPHEDDERRYPGTVGQGNTMFVWGGGTGGEAGNLGDYATGFMFANWLRIHANNHEEIFKDIIADPNDYADYRAVLAAVNSKISGASSWDWPTLLRTWMLSNYYYDNTTNYIGYGGDSESPNFVALIDKVLDDAKTALPSEAAKITRPAWNLVSDPSGSVTLYPGEGVFSKISGGSYTPATGANIAFAGLPTTLGTVNTAGPAYTGATLLTYNANTDKTAASQQGAVADKRARWTRQSASGARSMSGGTDGSEAGLLSGPVDWRMIIGKPQR